MNERDWREDGMKELAWSMGENGTLAGPNSINRHIQPILDAEKLNQGLRKITHFCEMLDGERLALESGDVGLIAGYWELRLSHNLIGGV